LRHFSIEHKWGQYMNSMNHRVLLVSVLLGVGFTLESCGEASVEGSTYEGNGGVVKIEFQSSGKASAWMGPVSSPCTYDQSGKTVTLSCQGDKDVFIVNDDGSLSGPPNGMLAHLTKKKA
jgi:hypothetical protein